MSTSGLCWLADKTGRDWPVTTNVNGAKFTPFMFPSLHSALWKAEIVYFCGLPFFLQRNQFFRRQISNPPTPIPHQCSKPPNFKSANASTSLTLPHLTFDFGGYDYWRLYGYWWVRRWRFWNLVFLWVPPVFFVSGSYHKRKISNPSTPLPT